jgi:murein DD-endopeptidase MepM/ murein hydrolase activator NlpD
LTPTPLPVITDTSVISQVEVIEIALQPTLEGANPEAVITATQALTQTADLTTTQNVVPLGPPTPTPTPVPRTLQVPADLPDYQAAKDHFWFTRPFTTTYNSWGSYYYPYGTNARGQYFWHHGIDIQASHGLVILAVGDGTVVHAAPDKTRLLGPWPDFYGQAVMIEHEDRWEELPVYTLYGHVSEVLVQPGQRVKAGDPIARVGQLGVALGPHLHLEVRVGAATYYDTRNPDLWVQPDPGYGVIAGRVVDYQNYYVPQQLVTLHRANEPSRFWRQTYTYPDNEVNSDEFYGETFTFSDVPAGNYLLKTFFDGRQLTIPVTVNNQATSFVLLKQVQPPK